MAETQGKEEMQTVLLKKTSLCGNRMLFYLDLSFHWKQTNRKSWINMKVTKRKLKSQKDSKEPLSQNAKKAETQGCRKPNWRDTFPWKHLSIQIPPGSDLAAMVGALVPALVRNFTPHSPHLIQGAPDAIPSTSVWVRPSIHPCLPQEKASELTLAPRKTGLKKIKEKSVPEKLGSLFLYIFSPGSTVRSTHGSLLAQVDLRWWSRILVLPRARKNHIQIFLYSSPKSLPTNDTARTVNITKWKNKTKQVKHRKKETRQPLWKKRKETEVPNIKTDTYHTYRLYVTLIITPTDYKKPHLCTFQLGNIYRKQKGTKIKQSWKE